MNYAVLAPVAAAAVALFAALQARRLAFSPGWGDQAWFSLAAAASAGYAAGAALGNADLPDHVVVQATRLQFASMALEVWAWIHYGEAYLGTPPTRAERALRAALPALAAAALVPGVILGVQVVDRPVVPGAFVQRWVEPTWLGAALIAGCLGAAMAAAARYLAAWRRGVPRAGLHAAAVGALLLLGAADAAALLGIHAGPFMLDVGFVAPVVLVAGSLAARFGQDARELAELRGRLEALVEERTRALSRTQDALFRAERLAALGQVAAGVAHEVNGPAAVVAANLRFVRDSLPAPSPAAPGGPAAAEEVAGAIEESVEAMGRITGLVRRLTDAGRLATAPPSDGATDLLAALRGALAVAEARFGPRVHWALPEETGLRAGVPAEVLHDILLALLVNAGEAIPEERTGQVVVSAGPTADGLLRVVVRDDGRGLDPRVAARAFEPFFSTKPAGRGGGLGLSVARGLAERHGGALALAPAEGGGAEARLELPLARG